MERLTKKEMICFIFIILIALILRIWGIDFGLPDKYIIDEGDLVYWAFYTGSERLRPLMYLYAPLVPYILLVEFGAYFVVRNILGASLSSYDFFVSYLSDPTVFFLIGRITIALAGVATVWLVWLIGRRFYNIRIGFIASFFLALTFLHVKESHYIKQDVLAGLLVLASFYFALNILKKGKVKDYFISGVFLGLAVGAKYQSVLILPVIILAHFLKDKKIVFKKLAILGMSTFLIYSLTNPYFIIEPKATIEKTLARAVPERVLYQEHLEGKPVWWWYTTQHIPQGVGLPLFFSAIAGFLICLSQAKKRKEYLLLSALPIIFFLTVDLWTKRHYARYAVSLLPFFALGAAVFIDAVSRLIENKKTQVTVAIIVSLLFIYPSALRSIKFNVLITKPDTRKIGREWIEKNIPAGTKVLAESTVRPEYPSNLNVPLILDEKSIEERISQAEARNQPAKYLKALRQVDKNRIGYDIVAAPMADVKLDIFTDEKFLMQDVNYYLENDVGYLVLTSWIQRKLGQEFEKSLNEHYQPIKEFRPTHDFQQDPHFVEMDYETLDMVDLNKKDIIFGPTIQVYRIKES